MTMPTDMLFAQSSPSDEKFLVERDLFETLGFGFFAGRGGREWVVPSSLPTLFPCVVFSVAVSPCGAHRIRTLVYFFV